MPAIADESGAVILDEAGAAIADDLDGPAAAPLAAATALPPVTVLTRQKGKSTARVGQASAAAATVGSPVRAVALVKGGADR